MKPGKTPFTGEERRHLRRRKYELMRTLLRQDNARELAASWAHWQAGWHKKPEAAQSSVVPLTPYQEIFALLTSQGEDKVVNQVGLFDLALPFPDPDRLAALGAGDGHKPLRLLRCLAGLGIIRQL